MEEKEQGCGVHMGRRKHEQHGLQIEKDREETIKLHLLTTNGELAKRIRNRPITLD